MITKSCLSTVNICEIKLKRVLNLIVMIASNLDTYLFGKKETLYFGYHFPVNIEIYLIKFNWIFLMTKITRAVLINFKRFKMVVDLRTDFEIFPKRFNVI